MNKDNSRAKVMEAIVASLTNICRIELPDCDYIDFALSSVGIEEAVLEADAGDQIAKTRMRHLAACYLRSNAFGPIPAALRQFAARELERLSKGTPDPNRPNGGRPPRAYREKLVIAHWIYKAIKQQGVSQNVACSDLAEHIGKDSSADIRSPEALRRIFCEVLPDIKALYEEVPKIKATVIPIRSLD
jgi:hypothetical protein